MKGKAGRPRIKEEANIRRLQLRLPLDLIEEIDKKCKNSRSIPSRHAWIINAIVDKLKQDE